MVTSVLFRRLHWLTCFAPLVAPRCAGVVRVIINRRMVCVIGSKSWRSCLKRNRGDAASAALRRKGREDGSPNGADQGTGQSRFRFPVKGARRDEGPGVAAIEEGLMGWLATLGLPQVEEETRRQEAGRQLRIVLVEQLVRGPVVR